MLFNQGGLNSIFVVGLMVVAQITGHGITGQLTGCALMFDETNEIPANGLVSYGCRIEGCTIGASAFNDVHF
jgi:hypothetical protein